MCNSTNNTSPTYANLLEHYKIAVNMHKEEANRYWTRNNVFLILNGALLAIFSKDIGEKAFIIIVVSFIGITISLAWFGILNKGKSQIERWRKVIDSIENNFQNELKIFSNADAFANQIADPLGMPNFLKKSASKIMNDVIKIIIAFWELTFFITIGFIICK